MIGRYNHSQIIRAGLAFAGGLICFLLAYLFFRYVPAYAAAGVGFRLSALTANLIAFVCLAAVAWTGYRTWRAGGGLQGYHESAFYHDFGEATGGAYMMEHYAHRFTGTAYLLVQTFLAGPLQVLRAGTLLASLLPNDADLEGRLERALGVLRAANKWESLSDYPSLRTEILYLAQMGLIDFSAYKGDPRIKAR